MIKLMLVDDEPIFREHLCTTVDWLSHGFVICAEAENGKEALEKLEACCPDIVLVDINMPYMDGLRLSEILTQKYPGIFIVIVTGHDEFEYAKRAVRLGMKDYILKPFDNEELMGTLLKLKEEIMKVRGKWYNQLEPDCTNADFCSGTAYENLMLYLKAQNAEKVEEELEHIFECVEGKKISVIYFSTICSGLISLCLSSLTEAGKNIETVLGTGFSPLEEIRNRESVDDLKAWIKDIFRRTLTALGAGKLSRSENIAEMAKEYIAENYREESLNVEKIARSLFINSRYLRRVFTAKTRMTLVDYITRFRMQKAAELLEGANIKHAEIAKMLGYSDAYYFSRCFKRFYGISPSEYERNQQRGLK